MTWASSTVPSMPPLTPGRGGTLAPAPGTMVEPGLRLARGRSGKAWAPGTRSMSPLATGRVPDRWARSATSTRRAATAATPAAAASAATAPPLSTPAWSVPALGPPASTPSGVTIAWTAAHRAARRRGICQAHAGDSSTTSPGRASSQARSASCHPFQRNPHASLKSCSIWAAARHPCRMGGHGVPQTQERLALALAARMRIAWPPVRGRRRRTDRGDVRGFAVIDEEHPLPGGPPAGFVRLTLVGNQRIDGRRGAPQVASTTATAASASRSR